MTSLGDGGRHNGRATATASDDKRSASQRRPGTVDQAYIPTASLGRVGACLARRVLIMVTVVVGLPASYPIYPDQPIPALIGSFILILGCPASVRPTLLACRAAPML